MQVNMLSKSLSLQVVSRRCLVSLLFLFCSSTALFGYAEDVPKKNAYFGDTHVHTLYSFDAFMFNVRTTPDDAYRYALGDAIDHPNGLKLRISGPPLDFLMVSEHAKYIGVFAAQLDPESPVYGHPDALDLVPSGTPLDVLSRRLRELAAEKPVFMGPVVTKYAWQKVIEAAERHNKPGQFTTFIGYEYTPTPGGRHLHRNVIFKGSDVPEMPFSSADSVDPEDLWDWLDELRAQDIEAMAIPHNMNQSDGLAFQTVDWKANAIDREFAEKRMRNEPIAEISQIKGTSETHPSLSPNDEWANFQIVQYYLNRADNTDPISVFKGGYYRDALKTGLEMQSNEGFNPYQMGVIGASDAHTSAAAFEENNYFTNRSNTTVARGSVYPDHENPEASWDDFWTPRQATHGTGGLAGVWAEENTRDALYDGMRRRETFATSGPRIRVRFFAGDLPQDIEDASDPVALAYQHGVPMGSELRRSKSTSPRFMVWATRDPNAGWLQRAQIIKGWVEDGTAKEALFDVACSDGLRPDAKTHRCPDNGAQVNLADCSISRGKGATNLKATWTDPEFDASQEAFYYVRVLENPSCRWSTWDAIRVGIEPNPDLAAVQQERAWSSPIWYRPN